VTFIQKQKKEKGGEWEPPKIKSFCEADLKMSIYNNVNFKTPR
jgi:hypothetical protein